MSRESEVNYSKRIQSYVRNLMVGQFKSTVVCLTCKKVSVCFDPYLLISLPIPANEEW
jgi:ubiquitin carboxyl-terminal hydrolase 4/11/15